MAKRTPEELLRALSEPTAEAEDTDEAADAEMDRILALSADERARELAQTGVDPEKLAEDARRLRRQAPEPPQVASTIVRPFPRRRVLGVVALLAAALTVIILVAARRQPELPGTPPGSLGAHPAPPRPPTKAPDASSDVDAGPDSAPSSHE